MKNLRPIVMTSILLIVGCQTTRPAREAPPIPSLTPTPTSFTPTSTSPSVEQASFTDPGTNEPGTTASESAVPHAEVLPPLLQKPVTTELTLPDLEQMALTASPSVARARALVEAARGHWLQVGLAPNPTVGYEGQQIGSGGAAEQEGLFVEQEIVRGGKLQLSRNVASQEVVKAEQELAAQQQRVLTDVRIAFYQVLIAERQASLTGELRQIAAEGMKTAAALEQAQEVGRVDLLQAQLELENLEILVENARNRSQAAWQRLASVLGNPSLEPQPLVGDLEEHRPPLAWETSLQRLLTTSPEIAAALAEIERARWEAERARVQKTPNVTVQGLVNWRDNGIGGGSDGGITVGIPLPVWDRNQGGVIQAAQEAVAAERALEQLEMSLQHRLAPVFERYANAASQVAKYQTRILPVSRQSLELLRKSYQAGETGYINLLTAQRTFSQTHLNYLESLGELRAAEAEIEGMLLSGSLDRR